MTDHLLPLEEWLARTAMTGGVILLFGAVGMVLTRQPARRQRLGELALLLSLVAAALCALPAWLPCSLPIYKAPLREAAPSESKVQELDLAFVASLDNVEEVDAVLLDEAVPQANFTPAKPKQASLPLSQLDDKSPLGPVLETRWGLLFRGMLFLGACAYAGVAAFLLFRLALGFIGLRRLVRDSDIPPVRSVKLFEDLTRGWRRQPAFRVSKRIRSPISFGLLRPVILVPGWLCHQEAEDKLKWILVHELTHLKRNDAWGGMLASLAQSLYFYQPCFWWIKHQVRLCQEYVADAAAAALSSSEDYADYLLLLSSKAPQRLPAGAGVSGVLGNSSDLRRRIAMLLQACRSQENRCPPWWSVAAGLLLTAVAVPVSGLGVHADEPEKNVRVLVSPTGETALRTVELEAVPAEDDENVVVLRGRVQSDADGKQHTVTIQAVPVDGSNNVLLLRAIQSGDEPSPGKKAMVRSFTAQPSKSMVVVPGDPAAKQEKNMQFVVSSARAESKAPVAIWLLQDDNGADRVSVTTTNVRKSTQANTKGQESIARVVSEGQKAGEAKNGNAGHVIVISPQIAPKQLDGVIRKASDEGKTLRVEIVGEEASTKDGFVARAVTVLDDAKAPSVDAVREALKKAQEAASASGMDEVRKQIEEALKRVEEARKKNIASQNKQLQEQRAAVDALKAKATAGKELRLAEVNQLKGFLKAGDGRLGVGVTPPSEELMAQIDLGKDLGLVISRVAPGSAAEKAGLKVHDIVIEFNGKPVSNNPAAFARLVDEVKAGEPVEAVVIRKGKKTVIKGINLGERQAFRFEFLEPEVKAQVVPRSVPGVRQLFDPNTQKFPSPTIKGLSPAQKLVIEGSGKQTVITTTHRDNDRFTTRHQEGSLIITITGSVSEGKSSISSIVIQDGSKEAKFDDLAKVPEQYRDKVKTLIDMSSKGQIKIEVKSGSSND